MESPFTGVNNKWQVARQPISHIAESRRLYSTSSLPLAASSTSSSTSPVITDLSVAHVSKAARPGCTVSAQHQVKLVGVRLSIHHTLAAAALLLLPSSGPRV